MCWLCDELESIPSCTDCGVLICFDVKHGDDIISSAHMTDDGDVLCEDCYRSYREQEEEDAADLDFGFFEDVMGDPFDDPGEDDDDDDERQEAYVARRIREHEEAGITAYIVGDFYEEYATGDLRMPRVNTPDDRPELDDIDLPF